jgi:hypothetical protein
MFRCFNNILGEVYTQFRRKIVQPPLRLVLKTPKYVRNLIFNSFLILDVTTSYNKLQLLVNKLT